VHFPRRRLVDVGKTYRLQEALHLVELLLTHPRLHLDLADDPLETLQPAGREGGRGEGWEREGGSEGARVRGRNLSENCNKLQKLHAQKKQLQNGGEENKGLR